MHKAAAMVRSLYVHEYSAAWLDKSEKKESTGKDNIGRGTCGYVIGANTANTRLCGRDATIEK
jgi:hypothetical protein